MPAVAVLRGWVAAVPAVAVLRGWVAAVPAVAALAFWRGSDSVFAAAEATSVWLGALGAIGLAALLVVRHRRLPVPRPFLGMAAAAYAGMLIIAALNAERLGLAVVGRAGRHTGLATALAAFTMAAVAAWAYRDRLPTAVRTALTAAAVPVGGYALVQAAGLDPLDWRYVEGGPPVFSTLGNATFLSAWAGVVAPLALWGALDAKVHPGWRATSAAVGVLLMVTVAVSGSLQGLAAGALGCGVVAAGWWTAAHRSALQRAAVAGVGLSVVGGVLSRADTLAAQAASSLATRVVHWQTAWSMAGDHPLTGVGFEGFVSWFRAYEAPDAGAARDLSRSLDSPHNVTLELLTVGGWPLLGAWCVLVLLVAGAFIRGWRRQAGQQRLALAAVGGGWLAYLVQASVSIDVPALAGLGAVLAGATLALGAPDWLGSRLVASPGVRSGGAIIALLALGLAVVAAVPLRADLAAGAAVRAQQSPEDRAQDSQEDRAQDSPEDRAQDSQEDRAQESPADLEALARARALAPWEPRYAALEGARLNRHNDQTGALAAYVDALRADPRSLSATLSIARLATAEGEHALADDAYSHAVEVAPHTPTVLAEAGGHALERDRPQEAETLLARAVAGDPTRPEWWDGLGAARDASSDRAGAASARQRAEQLRATHDP